MKAFFGLVMLSAMVNDNEATCTGSDADRVYYCKTFQKDYSEGTKTLIFEEREVGSVNSTVFSSPNLKSVVTLTLTGSRIYTIESGAFEHFSSLITLELQNNRLTTVLPSWFRDPTVLEQLNLAGNLIRQLGPGMLEGYSGLKVLNLSRNQISRIESESFATLSKLSSLDLSYNKISSLERKVFSSLNATLRLHGNPWNCSCGQKDLILFLQELVNASKLNDSTLVTCHYPPDLNGVIVWNVSEVNCSTSVLSPSSATVFHQIVLPALFVVLGGLFFSLSMWMIICFLRSQCKNKVTNMTDSKCNLQSSMEKEEGHGMSQDNHNQIFENHPEDTSDNRPVGLLHELDLKDRDIENLGSNSVLSHQLLHCGNHKTDDKLNRFVYPGLRADESKREGISKSLSAPMWLPCADKSSRGTLLKAEEPIYPTTTKVHPDVTVSSTENSVHQATTEVSFKPKCLTAEKVHSDLSIIPNKDPAHLEATEQTCDMTGIMSGNTASVLLADKCYSLGLKLNKDDEIDQKASENSQEDFTHETENPSLPPLPISLSKDRTLANQAIFSNVTCASLPNLSQYGNHKVCASHDDPFLISPIQASVNVDDNSTIETISFAGTDQPGIYVAPSEHLKNVFPYDINVPVLQDPTKSFVRSETEMNTVSSTTLALPIIDSLAGVAVDGNASLDSSISHLALPMINAQTDAIGSENLNHLSARPVELPAICEPLLGVAVQKTNFENMTTSNLYLPVVVKIELPAIKILEEKDNVRGSQSVEPEISSINKIIAIPDPGIAGKPSFENQSIQLNLEIKTQKSQILSEPNVDGVCASEENNMAVITLPTLDPFIGIIPNHGEITAGENEFTQTQEPPKHTEFSNVSLDAQTHLTTSISYSNSIQDGEEVSDWPKVADLVKRSSTISLSSNFDILNHTLVPHSIPKHENEYDTSNKSNTDLRDDKCEGAETMYNQPCHIDDHKNLAVEGLSFHCTVLQQYDMETDSRKSLNDMENKTFYIQDGTSQLYGTPSEEQDQIRILDAQDIIEDQPCMSLHYSEYAEKAQIQMENLEKVKGISNLDSHINHDIIGHTSYKDSIQTSNFDMVVNIGQQIHKRSEDPCRDQTEDAVYANDITVNHKGHHLTTPVNKRHSGEYEGRQDILKDLPYYPDAKIQTSEAEYPHCQTNMTDIGNYSNLGTAFITDQAKDFKGYEEKSNVKVNSSVTSMVDINHVGEKFEGISNLFQDMLSSDSTAVSEKIGTLAGSKRRDNVNADTSSDNLKTHFESDDSSGSKYKQKESDCNFDGSVNTLRKASGDVDNCITVCNSDATINNGQAHQVGVMDTSLCNAEIPEKMSQQLLGVQKVPETYSKQTRTYQKSQINSQLKTTSNVPPANVKNKLKDYLSSRIYRGPFYSVFPFSALTPSTEESEMVKSSTLRGKPSVSDSDTTRPSLVLSDRYTENMTMEAVEYLTYLYARGPKPKVCSGSLEGLNVVSDMDDISVLANLNFCKVALPGNITKQDMSTDVQEVHVDSNLEPADPEHVYVPPNKKELTADDELAVLHVIYTLKKSLELFPNSETETD